MRATPRKPRATTPPWKNRIVGYAERDPAELKAHALNWRTHGTFQRDALRGVLRLVGIVQNVIVSQRTNQLLDGHLRVDLALVEGQPTVPVTIVDVDAEEERLILASLDPLAALAEVDDARLQDLLNGLAVPDAALNTLLHDLQSYQRAPTDETPQPTDAGPQVDRAAELQAQWGTSTGQLWEIPSRAVPGRVHRLLCGDSTAPAAVARLIAGATIDLLTADPPYGVAYAGARHKAWRRFANDPTHPRAYQTFVTAALQAFSAYAREATALYLWCSDSQLEAILAALAATGWRRRAVILWVKSIFVLSHAIQHYHQKHEPCIYASRGDAMPFWCGPANETTVWEAPKPTAHTSHPTEKPVELYVRAVQNSCRPGGVVAEIFTGSGTTLVACEQTGRIGYGCELDPGFVAVTLQRLQDLGLSPRLEGDA